MKIPTEPAKRKIIILAEESRIMEMNSAPHSGLDSPGICVLQLPVEEDNKTKLYRKLEEKIIKGQTLIQCPYNPDNYEVVNNDDPDNIFKSHATEKLFHLRNLCKYLGASYLEIYEETETDKNNVTKAGLKIPKTPEIPIKAKASVTKNWEECFYEKFEMKTIFTNKKLEMNVEKAKEYMTDNRLNNDTFFTSLLIGREGNNPVQEEYIKLKVNKDSKSALELVAQIEYEGFKIGPNFSREVNTREESTFTFYVDFRKEP
jgi:hypothetical protein